MATDLTVQVPDDVMERFSALAERECRTLEGQTLWLIKVALDAAERRDSSPPNPRILAAQTREERILAAQPLFAELRRVYLLAGGPSSRVLAKTIREKTATKISHTTVIGVINGTIVPSWSVLERIVKVLGGDVEHFRQMWTELRETGR